MSTTKVVTSKANPLASLKAYAALVGSIVTGLLALYGPETVAGEILTIIAIIATGLTTWVVPNAEVVPPVSGNEEVPEVEPYRGSDPNFY